jgi:regulator of cell morphogenesis and NO signaling
MQVPEVSIIDQSATVITGERSLRAIALAQPATIRVFERYNLDYCCGGRRPLAEACAEAAIELPAVLDALNKATEAGEPATPEFTSATATELIRLIVTTHHAFVRSELPRLLPLAAKVAARHGTNRPETVEIDRNLRQLADELIFHLNKEERILFPYVEALEKHQLGTGAVPQSCFATVESPIQAMITEHEAAGGLLAQMRAAADGFTPWPGSCPTVAGLYHGLDGFERDLHRHVHLENNLLFPKAIALEAEALAAQ